MWIVLIRGLLLAGVAAASVAYEPLPWGPPANLALGVAIGAAIIFFGLELFVPSGGILAGGGLLALVLGAIIAFRDTPTEFQPNRMLGGSLASCSGCGGS